MFEFDVIWTQREAILQGLETTTLVSIASLSLAILLGLLTAVGQSLPWRWSCLCFRAYVELFRNTPLLIQLYIFYKALPHLGIVLPPLACGIIALSLQTGAYLAEIFRAGLDAVPRQQLEGGLSLGLTRWSVFRLLLLPQAYRLVLPAVGNQASSVIKNSSLVAFITVPDLFWVVYNGGATEFRYLEFFTVGIVLYTLLCLFATGVIHLLESMSPLRDPAEVRHA